MMDQKRKDEIRARLAAATPGPWAASEEDADEFWYGRGYLAITGVRDGRSVTVAPVGLSHGPSDATIDRADAALIAHAPQDIADLLGENDYLRDVVALAEAGLVAGKAENNRLQGLLGCDTGTDCCICSSRIYGTLIGAGDGRGSDFAHPACFWERTAQRLISTRLPDMEKAFGAGEHSATDFVASGAGQSFAEWMRGHAP